MQLEGAQMGMYFNTVATTKMVEKINNLFNAGNIDYWKSNARGLFAPLGLGGKTWPQIAGTSGVFPDDGPHSTTGKKWKDWLAELENDVGDKLRAIFYGDLDPGGKCIEMIFLVVPKSSFPITVSNQSVRVPSGGGAFSDVITVNTPTVAAVRARVRARRKKKP
jgi:hypothetical protein